MLQHTADEALVFSKTNNKKKKSKNHSLFHQLQNHVRQRPHQILEGLGTGMCLRPSPGGMLLPPPRRSLLMLRAVREAVGGEGLEIGAWNIVHPPLCFRDKKA